MGDDHTPLKTVRIRQKELRFSLAFSIQSGSKYLAVQMLRGAGITQRGQNADGVVNERCSAGRSSFFMMNAVGSRFGCLHLLTSLRLYSTTCVPLMLYGSELWCPTRSEILMLERVHRKILRTIQGLPVRCHHLALQTLVGQPSILTLIHQRLLSFAQSFSDLPHDPLPSEVLFARLSSSPQKGLLYG